MVFPDHQEVLLALAVAVIAPAVPALIGIAPRLIAFIGIGGALVLWLILTLPAPSDDREISKTSYGVLYAAVVLLWFGVWMLSTFLTLSLRKASKPRQGEGARSA
jgi:hypothetical protein